MSATKENRTKDVIWSREGEKKKRVMWIKNSEKNKKRNRGGGHGCFVAYVALCVCIWLCKNGKKCFSFDERSVGCSGFSRDEWRIMDH